MKKIMFNDKYGLTQAVLEGRKTQTRRIVYTQNGFVVFGGEDFQLKKLDNGQALLTLCNNRFKTAHYKISETIAIAQKYEDLIKNDDFTVFVAKTECLWSASNTREGATTRCLSVQTLCPIIFALPTSA